MAKKKTLPKTLKQKAVSLFKISVKVEDVNNKTFINSTVITVAEAAGA